MLKVNDFLLAVDKNWNDIPKSSSYENWLMP
jgi:hypothetical protein